MATYTEDVKSDARVVIVGAGPVGLLTALRLGQAGIDTLVIEKHDTLLPTTRATVYMPVVIPVLRELGILDLVMQNAYLNTEGIAWRDLDGRLLARLPLSSSDSDEFDGVLMIGQWRVNSLILEELQKYPSVQVRFNCKLASLENDPSSSKVTLRAQNAQSPSSPEIVLTASYVLGTDGANSTTRRLLDLTFEGFTYAQFRMIGIDVAHDFIQHENMNSMNFVVHPTDWAVIAYTGQDEGGAAHNERSATQKVGSRPQWRVAYVESPSLPDDQASIRARAQEQLSKYIRSGGDWTLLRAEPYTMNQRCASAAIVHRVALAGDALHSNNPIGGLGLTGGILDAFCYGNALIRTVHGDGDDDGHDLLTRCARSRLQAWKDTTDTLSQANMARLFATDHDHDHDHDHNDDAAVAARNDFFEQLNGPRQHEVAAQMRQAIERMLGHDFAEGVEKWIVKAS